MSSQGAKTQDKTYKKFEGQGLGLGLKLEAKEH